MNTAPGQTDFSHELVQSWIHRRLDGGLGPETLLHLDQHLERCAACREFEHRVRLLDRRLRAELPAIGVGRLDEPPVEPVTAGWLRAQLQRRARVQERARSIVMVILLLIAAIGVIRFLATAGEQAAANPPPSFVDLDRTQTAIAAWPTATIAATQTPGATPLPRPTGRLLYEASDNRSTDLYITYADATGRALLGPHPNSERAPHPSPDGRQVAFLSNRVNFGQFEIYLMDSSGGRARMITEMNGKGRGWTGEMAWSPDGRFLVAVYDHGDPALPFEVVRGDMPNLPMGYDGQWEGQLFRIDVVTGSLEALTPRDLLVWRPIWSPDGRRVYFNALREGYSRIYWVRAEGGDLQPVGAPGGVFEQAGFSISPDGRHLAYLALRRSRGSLRSDELRLINTATGEQQAAVMLPNTAEVDLSLAARFSFVRWSPDGSRLAYGVPQPNGSAVLKMLSFQAEADPSGGLRVDSETVLYVGIDLYFPGHLPSWSPDSRSLAILIQRRVYVISARADVDVERGSDLLEIYSGKRDEIGAGWLSWMP